MSYKKYVVELDCSERKQLKDFISKGKASAMAIPASLYEAFPAAEARRLVERFEWHYTPKHGSWLNMAESELSVLSRQCLDRRIANRSALTREVNAWLRRRNKYNAKADWHFTSEDARIKLKSLYPAI